MMPIMHGIQSGAKTHHHEMPGAIVILSPNKIVVRKSNAIVAMSFFFMLLNLLIEPCVYKGTFNTFAHGMVLNGCDLA